jgi:choline dehydrogenase-like flavoprotein
MLIDARHMDDRAVLNAELIVVGAGPAGISIVDRLRDTGLSICLIDGGGLLPEFRSQALYRGESVGRRYFRLDGCRFRQFGGSSNRWGGWCWPLNSADFASRDWLAWSGWPIDRAEIEPWFADTARLLQLRTSRFDTAAWPDRIPPPFELSGSGFANSIAQYSPETNFGVTYRDRILSARHVTTLLHANVTELVLDAHGHRVTTVQVRTLNGRSLQVQGRAVVLAAGGIENPRLLLASRRVRPAGIGNEHDLVGRFFMEHLHVPAGHLTPHARPLDWDFYRKATYDGRRVRGLLTPTADAQATRRLLACSIAIEDARYAYGTPFIGWSPLLMSPLARAYGQLQAAGHTSVAESLRHAADRTWSIGRHASTWRSARRARMRPAQSAGDTRGQLLSLYFRSEQSPNPSSRVRLSNRRDELGVPRAQLDWQLQDSDTGSILAWLRHLDTELRRRSLGSVIAPEKDWREKIIGGPHHIGTTRMSADPRTGVVDASCRVHSVQNLYVAGSSVFSTGGHVNPTFTLVALALRLADELERALTEERLAGS